MKAATELGVVHRLLLLLLLLGATTLSAGAGAAQLAAFDQCRLYGYVPHTLAYAQCRMDVRQYWTTGPCGDPGFAWSHREYCHLNLPPFI